MSDSPDPWFVHPSHLIGGCPYCIHCGAALPGGTQPSPFPISKPCLRSLVEQALSEYAPALTLSAEERDQVLVSAMTWLKKPGNADDPHAPWFAAYEATDTAIHRRNHGNRGEHETWSRDHDWNS